MGFHVIIRNSSAGLVHQYLEEMEDIAYLKGLTSDVIIYQGERHWIPVKMGESTLYKAFLDEGLRAGLRAQRVFQKICREKRFIAENLSQDKASFEQYRQE